MVERERERQKAGAAHETAGRPDAGKAAEGPKSEPVPPSTKPAATAAPLLLEEPPVKCSLDHGLRGAGNGKSRLGPPIPNSCVASLLKLTMPAAASWLIHSHARARRSLHAQSWASAQA